MDRYAVLQKLSDPQNCLLGVAAGAIEAASTQPLTYVKNSLQQKLAVSLDPRVVYRGTPASCAADGTLIGVQFLACGFLQKRVTGGAVRDLTLSEEVVGVNLAIDTLWQLLAAFMVRVLIRGYQPVLPTNSRFEGFVRASA